MTRFLLCAVAVPVVWTACVIAVRYGLGKLRDIPDDAGEKRHLALLLAPAALGLMLSLVARLMPAPLVHLHVPQLLPPVAPPAVAAAGPVAAPAFDPWPWLIGGLAAIYFAGLAFKAARLIMSVARLRRIVNLARLEEVAGEVVHVTAGDVPPLAWGRDIILLPESLTQRLNRDELAMMIRHEREHLHRGDTAWFAILAWIDAVFWFNPFVRLQTGRCRTAAELACDAAVTRAAPAMRQVYAGLLVETLKHAAGDVRQYAPAVISTCKSGDYRMRLTEIMHAAPSARKPKPWLYAGLAAAIVPLAFAQFAWSQGGHDTVLTSEPIEALADGTVTAVSYAPADGAAGRRDKTTVVIDYGDGVTGEFAAMGTSSFKVGDHVTAGQKLAEDGFPMTVTMEMCRQETATADKVCQLNLSSDAWRSTDKDTNVMWGNVLAEGRGRVIHADIAFIYDKANIVDDQIDRKAKIVPDTADTKARMVPDKTRVVEFDGHVSIEAARPAT